MQDGIIEVIDTENILEEITGRILGKGTEMREIIVAIELGTGISQETNTKYEQIQIGTE